MDKIVPVQTIKACGSEESHIHSFLTSTICGGEWPASRPGHFTPGESLLLADQECGRASQAARTIWRRTEYLPLAKHLTVILRASSPFNAFTALNDNLHLFQCVGTASLRTTKWPFWDSTSYNYCIPLYSCRFLDYFRTLNSTTFEMLIRPQFIILSDIWHYTFL